MDCNNQNFIKKTNASQFQKLVELMEHYPQIATSSSVFGSSKVSVKETWASIATQINAFGPPMFYKSLQGTGGGACTVINLTGLELHIDSICHLLSATAPSGTVLCLSKGHHLYVIAKKHRFEPPLAAL